MIPRIGEAVRSDQRYTMRPGAYVILPKAGRLLLTIQWGDIPEVQLPGGGIDPGEALRPALYREVLEETGWTIGMPVRLGAFRRFVFMPEYDLWAEKLCHVYLAQPGRRMGPPLEDGHEATWMSPMDALDVLGNSGDRMFVARALRQGLLR